MQSLEADCAARPRLSPIKRETFCVQDSPLKQLPPAIQKRLMKANGAGTTATAGPSKPRLSTSSPIRQPATQPKMALRSKAGLAGPRGVLPSKPSLPVAAQTPIKMRPAPPDKNKLQPPTRGNLGLRRSMSCRTSTRMGSTEDLLSDSASITSDISDTSLNSSLTTVKRSIPPPSKPVLRRPSAVKAPVIQTQRVPAGRRNTSSSSSSVSSINSSTSASPMPKAKVNASLNSNSISAKGVPTATKSRRSSVVTRAPEPPVATRKSTSVQGRKPSESLAKPARGTPCKKPDPTPVPTPRQTPGSRRSIAPSSTMQPVRADSAVRGNPKLTGLASATPSNPSKGVSQSGASPDGPRIMKPKRLLSACSMESLTQKSGPPAGLQTPSSGRDKSLPVSKMRRLSALPTTSGHHASSVPIQTPKSSAKPQLSRRTDSIPAPSRKTCFKSPSQAEEVPVKPQEANEAETPSCEKQASSVNKPEPCSPVFSMEAESDTAPPTGVAPDAPELVMKLEPQLLALDSLLVNIEPQPAQKEEKAKEQTQLNDTKSQKKAEVLLMDLPAPEMTNEKPLIDLSNTPDLIRTASVKSTEEQLIDLSSPLIKWSPEDKKENDVKVAPLIDLSF
ncbi:hypothetical protein ACEWY4_010901 [Coilia grayii]|uniref:G2 and S phase-expressed protein 1 N-terminal domain-containing protein n=1 Tax=Coilia grayii TaxID=363190 RepID=A0ABD1K396_9TELE